MRCLKTKYRRGKLSQWCVCGTLWGSSLTSKERGDDCLKCCMKTMWTHPTMREEISFSGGKSRLCPIWKVRGNGCLHLERTVYIPPSSKSGSNSTSLCPMVTQ